MMAAAQMGMAIPGMAIPGMATPGMAMPGMPPTPFVQPPAPQPPSHDAAQATGLRRIFVGGVPFDINADQVKAVFSPFGTILRCDLLPDNTNPARHRCATPCFVFVLTPVLTLRCHCVCRGYGFIEFESPQSAQEAVRGMDGFMLGGRILKVGWATNAPATAYGPPAAAATTAASLAPAGGGGAFQPAQQRAEQIAAMISANTVGQQAAAAQRDISLSAEENVTISSSARQELMQKLSARAQMPSTDHFKCVMLTNMVDLSEADDPELKEEVSEEARRYGTVEDVAIKVRNNQVFVYLQYHDAASAKQAVAALNNRCVLRFPFKRRAVRHVRALTVAAVRAQILRRASRGCDAGGEDCVREPQVSPRTCILFVCAAASSIIAQQADAVSGPSNSRR